jgi:hypothetical protein
MDDETGHPLKELALGLIEGLEQWEQEYPDLKALTAMAGHLVQALMASTFQLPGFTASETLCLLLWQQMTKYQFQSLLQLIGKELDTGYTLLRNATELVRDIAFVHKHPEATERWYAAKHAGRSDPMFRFDRSEPYQAYVHDLYTFACRFGTHGHMTGLSSSAPAGLCGRDDVVQVRQVTGTGRDEGVVMWLLGFVPMQSVCAQVFLSRGDDAFREFFRILSEHADLFHKVATRLQAAAKSGS